MNAHIAETASTAPRLTARDLKGPTVGDLIDRYMDELDPIKQFGVTHRYGLEALLRSKIAKRVASELEADDIIAHCRARKAAGAGPATVMQDVTYLRGPLGYAKGAWKLEGVSTAPIDEAMPLLKKYGLIAKSRPRDRRPSREEFDQLIDYFKVQDKHSRTQIPMAVMMEFAVYSARRISEITRLQWGDVNHDKRTCIVRDMKDPKHKKGNHHEFPLLGRAWDIVLAQPRMTADPLERIFPYNAKSAGQRYTLAKKELGIEDLRFHDLRREAASRLFEAGFSVQEVMLVTGHKTPNILLRVYTKLKAEDLHKGPAASRKAALANGSDLGTT